MSIVNIRLVYVELAQTHPNYAHMACMKSEIPIKHVFPVVVSYTIFYKQLLKLKNEVGMAMLKSKQE